MLPMDFCHMYAMRERRERAIRLLEQVGVADRADKLPSTLSGGQQQRVVIARALSNDPPILAADEPTGNLDSRKAESVFGLFETLVAQGKTILMVTHDRDLARRATRTVILSDGEVIEDCPAKTGVGADPVLGVEGATLDRAAFEGVAVASATAREVVGCRVAGRVADQKAVRGQRGNGHV
jgi:ABC-type polar amino acid transport system ATPase subunit